MADIETATVSESGFASTSQAGDFELTIDATGEEGPGPNKALVADYAACFVAAIRAGADKHGYDDIGKVQIDADADVSDGDDLESIRFTVHIGEDIDDGDLGDVMESAEDICHVRAALREELHADLDVHDDAF